ncbi:MAG: hypothetical protein E7270_01195 [Lachnospiraceae bacterium]|nr:hypothetical protein [Lachnospiraceae bacterium]
MALAEFIPIVFQVIILPLLGILTKYLVAWISAKTDELKQKKDNELYDKYLDLLETTITDCVIATNQTYVDTLKAEGKFDAEAQKLAFQKTYEAIMAILTEDAKEYLIHAIGDFDAFVNAKIEANVKAGKTSNG